MNSKKLLYHISFAITALTLAAVGVLFFAVPRISGMYLRLVEQYTEQRYTATVALGMSALVIAAAALSVLLWLLHTVGAGKVFSARTQHIMSILSLCCFLEVAVFIMLGMLFLLSYIVAFAAFLLGVLLLVLRCVLSEATEIKNENDFTV